jgi:hypothetical protein
MSSKKRRWVYAEVSVMVTAIVIAGMFDQWSFLIAAILIPVSAVTDVSPAICGVADHAHNYRTCYKWIHVSDRCWHGISHHRRSASSTLEDTTIQHAPIVLAVACDLHDVPGSDPR